MERKALKKILPLLRRCPKIWLGAAAGLAVLAAMPLGLAYGYYHSKVALLQYSESVPVYGSHCTVETAVPSGAATREAARPAAAPTRPAEDIAQSPDIFNLLLIGTDERTRSFSSNARGDSCMLLSLNKETMQAHLVSFERSIGVPILSGRYAGQWDWLTHTFRYGGAELMLREIGENFQLELEYYARANIYTFMQLIDAVGGVDITLTQAEADYINHPQGTYAESHIREMGVAGRVQPVKAGPNRLGGAAAMLYARCRWIDNDWRRIERQRKVMDALLDAAATLGPGELDSLLDAVLPCIQTNLPEREITALLLAAAPRLKDLTLEQATVPAKGTYGTMTGMGGRSLLAVDFAANAAYLRQILYGPGP